MEVAELFEVDGYQAVRLPEAYRLPGDEVYIRHLNGVIVLIPKDKLWATFLEGLHGFSDDFMADGRPQESKDSIAKNPSGKSQR